MRAWAGVAAVIGVLCVAPAAQAGALNSLGFNGKAPDVAVDNFGNGYFTWVEERPGTGAGNDDRVHFCEVGLGGGSGSCAITHDFVTAPGEVSSIATAPRIYASSDGSVVQIFYGANNFGANPAAEGTYAWRSTTGGATFNAPVLIAPERAHDFALGPNANIFVPKVSLVNRFVSNYTLASQDTAGASATAALATPGTPTESEIELNPANDRPVITYYSIDNNRIEQRHWTGVAPVTDPANWTAPATVVSGTGNQSAPLSAGPSGLFLASYPIGSPVEVRKWTGSAFGAAVQVSTERASGVHIRVARNGDVHVIYAANDGNEVIRHVVSTDGGATWSAPQTVGRNTTTRPWAAERVAAAPSGTGFVAMETDSTGTNEPLGFVDLSDLGGAALPGSGTSGGGGGGTGGGGGGTVPVLVTRSVTLGNQTFTARVPTTCVKAGQNLRMTISRKTKKGAKPVPGFKVRRLDQLIDGKRRAYVIASNVGKVLAKGYLDYHTGKTKSFPALKAGKHVAGLKILFKYKKGGKKKKGSSTLKLPFTICP